MSDRTKIILTVLLVIVIAARAVVLVKAPGAGTGPASPAELTATLPDLTAE